MEKKDYDSKIKTIKEEKIKKMKELDSFMWKANRESRFHYIKRLSFILIILVIVGFVLFNNVNTTLLMILGIIIITYFLFSINMRLEYWEGPFGINHYVQKDLGDIKDELEEIKDKLDGPYGINSNIEEIKQNIRQK